MSHAAHIASTSFLMHQMLMPRLAKKPAEKMDKPLHAGESLDSRAVSPVNDERGSGSRDSDSETDDGETDDRDAGANQGFDLTA